MAPKVSINIQVSKIPSNNISFKNKRRRKFNSTSSSINISSIEGVQANFCNSSEANKSNKSPKHRWKLNKDGCYNKEPADERCMTNNLQKLFETRKCFQQQFSHNNLLHDMRGKSQRTENKAVKRCFSNDAKNYRQDEAHFDDVSSTSKKRKPQRRGLANCRQLFGCTTASSVRKLLPIFILVNMLPFLYAGESMIFC